MIDLNFSKRKRATGWSPSAFPCSDYIRYWQFGRTGRGVTVRYEINSERSERSGVVATEWSQFRDLDMGRVRLGMKGSHLLVDGRNVFEPREMKELGFVYVGIGR